jgi:hypothetical protein
MRYRRALVGLLFAAATSAAAVLPAAAAHATTSYTMKLSPSSATVRAGHATRTKVSFVYPARLRATRVSLSVSGLPSGVTASFSPATPRIGGRSTLTLTAAPASPAGEFAVTVTAITLSSDPIGTSTGFDLAIDGG